MSEEEKNSIEYLKSRLYGNEGCKLIDVAQSDLRTLLNLIEKQQKEIEELKEDNNHQWKERCKLFFKLENSISKDKIREKIKELEQELEEERENGLDFTLIHEREIDINGIIEVLHELLEEE